MTTIAGSKRANIELLIVSQDGLHPLSSFDKKGSITRVSWKPANIQNDTEPARRYSELQEEGAGSLVRSRQAYL